MSRLTEQLVEVVADDVPHLSRLLAGEGDQVSLAGDDGDLIDGVQDQVQDALLLTQVLAVPQRAQLDLTLLVLCTAGQREGERERGLSDRGTMIYEIGGVISVWTLIMANKFDFEVQL